MNEFTLKTLIVLFFSMGIFMIFSFVQLVKGGNQYFLETNFIILTLSFLGCLALYQFVLKDEFEKIQKEYEETGSLKKIVKKWKESDKEE